MRNIREKSMSVAVLTAAGLGLQLAGTLAIPTGTYPLPSLPALLRESGAWAAPAAREPYAESELRALETPEEAKIRDLREQEINQLRVALGRRMPQNRQAELYFRLAEAYLEGYRAMYLLEGRVHDQRLEKGRQERGIDHTRSRPYLQGGIHSCLAILKFNIPFDRLDRVYYFLGFNYGELGDRKQSLKHFQELARRFPTSSFATEAQMELGDAAFGDGRFPEAARHYETAIPRANADTAARLYHKLAWCRYRMKQYDRAVDTMKHAISAAQKSGERLVSLREEALRDMAVFMTETGKVDEAISYFGGVVNDRTYYPKVLERLGKQYERNVEPEKATQVYESLLKTNPESEAAFRVLVKLIDLDLRRRRFNDALARIREARIPKERDAESATAFSNLKAMVRRTATEHHEIWRKKKDKAALDISEQYYSAYLRHFLALDDARQETPEIQMYLAEVKREQGKAREASELYRKVIESRDRRYAKEAGALWTASLAEAIKKQAPQGQSHGQGAGRREPSPMEQEFVSAADSMQEALGDVPEGREAALKAAEVLAGYSSTHKDSIKRAQAIIARAPKSPQAVTAARLWLQLQAEKIPATGASASGGQANLSGSLAGSVEELREAVQSLRANAPLLQADQEFAKGKLKVALADQETRLKVLAIARSEQDQDFAAAARGYENFARDAGTRDLAEKAYTNALASYARVPGAEAHESLERVSAAWLKRFPKSPKAAESLRSSATMLLVQGRFDASIRLFARLGMDGADAASLETAARLTEGLGNVPHALELWGGYLNLYKGASLARSQAALALGRLREAQGQDSEAARAYQDCLAGPEPLASQCGALLGDLHLRARNYTEARAFYKRVAGASAVATPKSGKSGRGGKSSQHKVEVASPYVGYARYKLATFMEEEARFAPLQFPESVLKSALNQRLEFLEPLSRSYSSAVEAGGPWAIASLSRLAAWAVRFADEIDQIAPPAGADPAAIARFRQSLLSISAPLRKKAAQTWFEAYSKANAWEVLSPTLPEISDLLADSGQARGQAFGRAQGARGRFRLAGIPADGGSSALERIRDRLSGNLQDAVAWTDYGNLLWGERKPLLARIAYDRALALNPRLPAALNNRAVVALLTEAGQPGGQASGQGNGPVNGQVNGEEAWLVAAEASIALAQAYQQDPFFVTAKFNHALLLNYYRLFSQARPLWDQVLVKSSVGPLAADAYDGLGVTLQGTGRAAEAEQAFRKASEQGAAKERFSQAYHEAARAAAEGGAAKCRTALEELDVGTLAGFEKDSHERLKRSCR